MEQNQDQSCKTPRWRLLKAQLNNLLPKAFEAKISTYEKPIIIDVRTAEEFKDGHIEGAVNISYFEEDLWEQLTKFGKHETFFIYCRTGRRSIRVCTLMKNGGFDEDKIFNLDGGLIAWKSEL